SDGYFVCLPNEIIVYIMGLICMMCDKNGFYFSSRRIYEVSVIDRRAMTRNASVNSFLNSNMNAIPDYVITMREYISTIFNNDRVFETALARLCGRDYVYPKISIIVSSSARGDYYYKHVY